MDHWDEKIAVILWGYQKFFCYFCLLRRVAVNITAWQLPSKICWKVIKLRSNIIYTSSVKFLIFWKTDWWCRNCYSWRRWGSCSTKSEKYSGEESSSNIPFPYRDEGATLLGNTSGMSMLYYMLNSQSTVTSLTHHFNSIKWWGCWESVQWYCIS